METPGKPTRRPIYEASFEDEPVELSPEMAHSKAMKESERMKKMREEVSVSRPQASFRLHSECLLILVPRAL
jgi:hypothetical protein